MIFIYFILVFGTIITIHELGHLLAAKKFNVYCEEFSFGMGPKVIGKKYNETNYNIRLFPIGGFVSMAGEAEANFDDSEIPFERTIKGIAKWKQIIVMLAGVFMNFLLAIMLFISINLINRQIVLPNPPIIAEVSEGSIAEEAGFLADDEVVEIIYRDNEVMYPKEFTDIGMYFELFKGEEINFIVKRGNEEVSLFVTPKLDEASQRYLIGISAYPSEIGTLSFGGAIKQGFIDFKDGSLLILKGITFLFRGIGLNQLSGPIGIIDQTDQIMGQANTFKDGALMMMYLIALFSVNLGIFNLIPLPMFDGGRVVLLTYEIIFKRRVNKKVENGLMLASVAILILLVLFTTYNDLIKVIFR